ncbi:ChrA protein [Saccharibacillus sp. O23]|uniref:chromate efflux transporter n=1 Tax=Saccharibacillus sp. O23 TaxID=2009338 RepID=UPI000B4E53FA|nr:chromate efflux transporter [Saccharibacillus sp. O23]OWR28195.1 ChrA protein [Saccharibacillus sp. O23]
MNNIFGRDTAPQPDNRPKSSSRLREIFAVSLKLGLTSFGGPVAHLGYFREEYVRRRKWIDERDYGELVALCQFLPGPASSQVGMGIGMMRGGVAGALLAWAGFTLPSVALMILFALLLQTFDASGAGWIHGLKIAAVAVVAQAVLGMGRSLAPDRTRAAIAVLAACAVLLGQTAFSQISVIAAAAVAGMILYRKTQADSVPGLRVPIGKKFAACCLIAFFALLALLPLLRSVVDNEALNLFDGFYRSGALVFGGGHVVLPLLEREVVPTGFVNASDFLSGYAAAQAVPGPLFTFAAYLGMIGGGWSGALICTVAVFLPAFLLVAGALPFWSRVNRSPGIRAAVKGANAAVVGILLAALYDPVWISAVGSSADFALAALLFVLLNFCKLPAWAIAAAGAAVGELFGLLF